MTQSILNQIQRRAGLSFHANLVIGAMLAALSVVTYAGLADAAVRTHIVLQGFEVILLTLGAGFIANALHAVSTVGDATIVQLPRDAIAA